MHPLLITGLTPLLRRIILRKLKYDPNGIPDVTFKLAETLDEKMAAFAMARSVYVRHGLIPEHQASRHVSIYPLLPTTTTLIAVKHGEVIATISTVEDSIVGFPFEKVHQPEALALRQGPPLRYAELSPWRWPPPTDTPVCCCPCW